MSNSMRNLSRSSAEYSALYADMRGVDFSGDGSTIRRDRFSYLENMYRDYDGDGAGIIESFPGFRKIAALGQRIRRIAGLQRAEWSTSFRMRGCSKGFFPLLAWLQSMMTPGFSSPHFS